MMSPVCLIDSRENHQVMKVFESSQRNIERSFGVSRRMVEWLLCRMGGGEILRRLSGKTGHFFRKLGAAEMPKGLHKVAETLYERGGKD